MVGLNPAKDKKVKIDTITKLIVFYFIPFALILASCARQRAVVSRGLKPAIISTLSNKNVYKTQEKLKVLKEYNIYSGVAPITTSDTFFVNPNPDGSGRNFIRYKVIKKEDKTQYIRVLRGSAFIRNDILSVDTGEYKRGGPNEWIFKVVDKDISPKKQYLASEKIVGMPITIPLKLRNQGKAKYRTNINASLGYAFGYKIKLGNNPYRDFYVNLIPLTIGVGIQKYVPVDSMDSKTFKAEDQFAYSLGMGATLEISKFNIGFIVGWDRMLADQKDWFYQNKPWVGLVLGYKFFASSEEEKK